MRRLILVLTLLSIAAIAVAGCGDEQQTAAGATELVPAGAVIYGEATIKPEGDQKEAVDALLAKFPGGDQALERLREALEDEARESGGKYTFKDDIEPWLGDQVGVFVLELGGESDFEGAVLLATTDEEAARAGLEKSAEGELTTKTYRGVEYTLDDAEDLNASVVLDGFAAGGSERGIKALIDAREDGPTLADDEAYENALDEAADDRLGLLYVNGPKLGESLQRSGMPLPPEAQDFLKQPFVATLDVDDDGVTVEAQLPQELTGGLDVGSSGDLLEELPADSWLALAGADTGELLDSTLDSLGDTLGTREQLEQQLRAATGLDLNEDVLGWMGDLGVFVRGGNLLELNGAVIVETMDEAASKRFLDALARLGRAAVAGEAQIGPLTVPGGGDGFTLEVSELPQPIHVFQREGRVVFAYGDAAASDAVDAREKLGDSADFKAARDSLGDDYEVGMYVAMQPLLALVDNLAGSQEGWQEAKPYLEPLSALVAGGSGEGDDARAAFKLIVK